MYTYLKLKNFKSFGEVELDLKKTEQSIKKLAVIYGENGAGKTNLVEAFKFIQDSLLSLTYSRILEKEIMSKGDSLEELENDEKFIRALQNFKRRFAINIKMEDMQTIGQTEDTEIEIGFSLNHAEGIYYLRFGKEIKEEKVYYLVGKYRKEQFHLIKNEKGELIQNLNEKIFIDSKYKNELETEIKKYWGKNTFLSIIIKEIQEKNKKYIEENISKNLLDVIEMLIQMNISLDRAGNNVIRSTGMKVKNAKKNALLIQIERGEIDAKDAEKLTICEEFLRKFFTQAYSEIKDVKYMKKEEDGKIKYMLYFYKMIHRKIVKISYLKESAGTLRILKKLAPIIRAALGEFVIIDEIDNGVHDLLIRSILESLQDKITGQLIITTHNTLLLETLNKSSIYLILTDYEGNKTINCMDDYDLDIQKNHNIRDLYLRGVFGGIPFVKRIDFDEMVTDLEEGIKNEEENLD